MGWCVGIRGELGREGGGGGLGGSCGSAGRARNQGQGSSACDPCWPQEVSMLPTDPVTQPSLPYHSRSATLGKSAKIFHIYFRLVSSLDKHCLILLLITFSLEQIMLAAAIASFELHDILLVYNYHNAVMLISYGFQTCILMAHNQGSRLMVPGTK